jgi:hypothetical protein
MQMTDSAPASYLQSDYKSPNRMINMRKYKGIHLWDLAPETQLAIKKELRYELITKYIKFHKTWKTAATHLNSTSKLYGQNTKYHPGIFGHWRNGLEASRGIHRNMPLWVAIEISKVLTNNNSSDNELMRQIEDNLEYYTTGGRGLQVKTNFPIKLTPELVSIIFHLCGDGHLANKGDYSHYRQVNPDGLNNFSTKLHNCFGTFETPIAENSKVIIPKTVSNSLKEYFDLNTCYWDVARINENIKKLPKEFLLAGLTAFIIDEGHLGDAIEIYSGNKKLLQDIREIIDKLGYTGYGPMLKKDRKGTSYRVYISLTSAKQFYEDIQALKMKFPTCGLAHKEHILQEIVNRQNRNWRKRPNGEMQNKILALLSTASLNSVELRTKLQICGSTLREHLAKLKSENKVQGVKPEKSCCILWSIIK